MKSLKQYNVPVLLLILVVTLSGVSFYNYNSQKNLLLQQMQSDAGDIVNSISSAMHRFHDIKATMNIQELVSKVSLDLEIFEFRYLESDGTISNSMFKEEIGHIHNVDSFKKTMLGDMQLATFFYETRDYVPVMAIYYPIYEHQQLVGIIDLSVDISEYSVVADLKQDFSLLRRQVDILNLLKAIEGSVRNSLEIYKTTDLYDFLHRYIDSAENIIQITLIDQQGKVLISSNNRLVGTTVSSDELHAPSLVNIENHPVYRMVTKDDNGQMMLLIDAIPYIKNEQRLLKTAVFTSAIVILFALFIAYAIYRSTKEQAREETQRLEKLVKERTLEIELLSKTDVLTGLWNRGYLEEMLDMEFKRARRYNHNISILMVDLDHFKHVNDTYGHMAGDEVLRITSKQIQECVRETDFVGRYGGEEIVIILPETSLETAETLGNKIRQAIAAEPVKFEGHIIAVTASIGASSLRAEHQEYQDVFSEADEALYISKEQGRNRVTIFKPA